MHLENDSKYLFLLFVFKMVPKTVEFVSFGDREVISHTRKLKTKTFEGLSTTFIKLEFIASKGNLCLPHSNE